MEINKKEKYRYTIRISILFKGVSSEKIYEFYLCMTDEEFENEMNIIIESLSEAMQYGNCYQRRDGCTYMMVDGSSIAYAKCEFVSRE